MEWELNNLQFDNSCGMGVPPVPQTCVNYLICDSKGTILQQFGAGEKVIRQGESGNALYIIIAGQVLVTVKKEFGMELEVLTILPSSSEVMVY